MHACERALSLYELDFLFADARMHDLKVVARIKPATCNHVGPWP